MSASAFTHPVAGWFGRPAGAPAAHDDQVQPVKVEDIKRDEHKRPTTGRNTAMGRRVERPEPGRTAGPSGQHDSFKHERAHTNK